MHTSIALLAVNPGLPTGCHAAAKDTENIPNRIGMARRFLKEWMVFFISDFLIWFCYIDGKNGVLFHRFLKAGFLLGLLRKEEGLMEQQLDHLTTENTEIHLRATAKPTKRLNHRVTQSLIWREGKNARAFLGRAVRHQELALFEDLPALLDHEVIDAR
jgi:hypothetical protein